MTQAILIATVVATIVVMVVCFTTDLRERAIYVFPCMFLTVTWGVMGAVESYDFTPVFIVVLIHLCVYAALKITHIWGDGDSDMFLLYGAVYGVFILKMNLAFNALAYALGELLGMIAALLISFFIGFAEALIKREKITGKSSIAVVPGLAVIVIGMVIAMAVKG